VSSPKRILLGLSVAVVIAGCNAILENREGTLGDDGLQQDTDGTEPAGGNPGPSEGAAGPEDDDVADEPCKPGTKPCGDVCASTDDPHFGCAGASCGSCTVLHATAACVGGACAVGACEPGWADCNGDPTDGCEADLALPESCGACGIVCEDRKNAVASCVEGACVLTCAPDRGDCNADPEDGCEVNLRRDKRNCGVCGRVCILGRCVDGACRL
jgi:hypothetical protein